MTKSELTVMLAVLRQGGTKSAIAADAIADTPPHLRPAMFAQALAAGRTNGMVKLINHTGISNTIANLAKERNKC